MFTARLSTYQYYGMPSSVKLSKQLRNAFGNVRYQEWICLGKDVEHRATNMLGIRTNMVLCRIEIELS